MGRFDKAVFDELRQTTAATQEAASEGRRSVAEDIQREESDMRARIANYFTRSFIFLVATIIIGVPIYNAAISTSPQFETLHIDLSDLLSDFWALFGSILGFVLGYYFKSREREK